MLSGSAEYFFREQGAPQKAKRRRSYLRRAAFEEQRCYRDQPSIFAKNKAHRKKPSDGAVICVERLSRSNDVIVISRVFFPRTRRTAESQATAQLSASSYFRGATMLSGSAEYFFREQGAPQKAKRRRSYLRRAAFEEQRCYRDQPSIFAENKAHRRKPSDGAVICVELLSRSNAVIGKKTKC